MVVEFTQTEVKDYEMIRSRNLGWSTARLRLADHLHDSLAAEEVQANISGRISRPNHAGAELVILWDSINILEHDKTLHPAIQMQSGKIYLGDSQIESLVLTHSHPGWMLEDFPYPPSRIRCAQGNQTSLRFRAETGEEVTFIPDFDHQLKRILPQLIHCLSDESVINAAALRAAMNLFPELEQTVMKITRDNPIIVQCLLDKRDADDWEDGPLPGFLVHLRSKYFFFEQGHLDGTLTLRPLSPPKESTELTSCSLTLPESYETSQSTLGTWTKLMTNIEVQYSPKSETPFFILSFENDNWTITPRYGLDDRNFDSNAGSLLLSCNSDVVWNNGFV